MRHFESLYFILILGSVFAIIQLITGLNYPIFRDEYYYIACTNHADYGYVDHPSFSILILTVWKAIFGDSQFSVRFIPALLQTPYFIFIGLIAKELGGNKKTQIIAVLTAAFAMPVFGMFGFYSMNSFDMVFWAALFYIVIMILNTGNKRLLYIFGITAGLGLMNKISILFFLLGFAVSLLLTEHKRIYKSRHFWYGMLIAGLIFLPYVIWQFFHDFSTIEFIRNAGKYKITSFSAADFIKEQFLSNNPVNAAFWFTGLMSLIFIRKFKKFSMLGILYLVVLIFFIINKSKPYYLFPAYSVLFAAGSVFLTSFFERKNRMWIVYTAAALVIITSAFLSPMLLPVLSPEAYINYSDRIGVSPSTGENQKLGKLPQLYADRFGWKELAMKVSEAYNSLQHDEKKKCIVYARNYGEAGAIDYYRKEFDLPPVVSGHNNYYYWIPDFDTASVVIIIGGEKEEHLKTLNFVTEFGIHSHPLAMPYENDLKIFIGRGFKVPFNEVKKEIKLFI